MMKYTDKELQLATQIAYMKIDPNGSVTSVVLFYLVPISYECSHNDNKF